VGQSIAAVAFVVADYDEVIVFFTRRLGAVGRVGARRVTGAAGW
jgi:hypothetical protein